MNYYFDSRRGRNERSGISPEAARRDFAAFSGFALQPGDRVLLKRGSHFRGQLRVRATGAPDRPIIITAYGEGPRPVIEGRRTGPIGEYDARIVPGAAHRIACMRMGRTLTHVVDGKAIFTWEDHRPLSSGRQPHVALYIHAGGWVGNVRVFTRRNPNDQPHPFAGSITDLRLYRRVLSAGEIAQAAMNDRMV